MEKMLVTQGLNELKTLDARIERAISESYFVCASRTSDKNAKAGKTKEKFKKEAFAAYDSIRDLIERRKKIKSAIVESNAKTMVELCGEEYSVAEVIDMKTFITYKEQLLDHMKTQYNTETAFMNKKNVEMEEKIDQLIVTAFGKESKTSIKEDDYISIAKPYRENNEYTLVDPIGIENEMRKLEQYIEEFKADVDYVLQVSNCVTYIEF